MLTERLALALAELAESGNASAAQLVLHVMVTAKCRRLRMLPDANEVLQEVWVAILNMMKRHVVAPTIAKEARSIIHNKCIDVIRARERVRKLDALWGAQQSDVESELTDERHFDEELSILLSRLRDENPRQHDAVSFVLHSADHHEARKKWQEHHSRDITDDAFRQMYHRATRKLRSYWEQSE